MGQKTPCFMIFAHSISSICITVTKMMQPLFKNILDFTNVKCFHIFCIHIRCKNKIIIIIINFYGACIFRYLTSEAQQNIIIKHNRVRIEYSYMMTFRIYNVLV